jgi:hypothetical protein
MKRSLSIIGTLLVLPAWPLFGGTVYNAIPAPQPYNLPSLGYQATQTAELGDLIQFEGGAASLTGATFLMSDWALASTYESSESGYDFPITLNLYSVDDSSGTAQPGAIIASFTETFLIPWRPEADPTCPGGTAWRAADGNCYNGYAFPITFDLGGVNVPSEIIFGIAFNTTTWGYSPTGESGPYDSLNVGLNDASDPTAGSRPLPDTLYWNTMSAGYYADGGAGGVGVFRQDSNWSPYKVAAAFNADAPAPEPGSLTLLAGGLVFLIGVRRPARWYGSLKRLPLTGRYERLSAASPGKSRATGTGL